LVDIYAPYASLADLRRLWQIIQVIVRDGRDINVSQSIQEAVQDFFQAQDDFVEPG
jgi:hypothetical protein